MCTPARGALLTGKYPIHLGLQHEVIHLASPWGLSLDETIMPQHLKTFGYKNYMFGKWHLGFYTNAHIPSERGFDYYLGYLGDQEHYFTHRNTNDG